MMAMRKTMLEQEPSEMETLLPWHAAGTLNARDARRVEEALARDPELARQYAVIREEYAATIDLNESLGAPSSRAMQKLFAAIDAEPARQPPSSLSLSGRIANFFAGLSPRALAWTASAGALALLLQAGLIGLLRSRPHRSAPTSRLPAPWGRRRRRALWCGSRRMPVLPTLPRCSTAIRPRLSIPAAACFGCNSATRRCRRMKSPG